MEIIIFSIVVENDVCNFQILRTTAVFFARRTLCTISASNRGGTERAL